MTKCCRAIFRGTSNPLHSVDCCVLPYPALSGPDHPTGISSEMKVIQVGIGGMGNAWLTAVQASPDVEFAALVEIDEGIAAAQCSRYALDDVPVFRTLPEALAAVDADGVINVTPPQFHEEVSVTALEAGVPVLSEKPLAHTPRIRPAHRGHGKRHRRAAHGGPELPLSQSHPDAEEDARGGDDGRCRFGDGRVLSWSALRRFPRGDALSADHRHVHPSLRPDALSPGQRSGGRLWQELESALELVRGRCVGRGDAQVRRRRGGSLQRFVVLAGA